MDIHIYVHSLTDPAVTDQLARIERKIGTVIQKEDHMSKDLDDATLALTASSTDLRSAFDSLVAFIQANANAQLQLAAEQEAEGKDATAIRDAANAQISLKEQMAALILDNTPVAVPAPAAVRTV
jgi:hypothetical protein